MLVVVLTLNGGYATFIHSLKGFVSKSQFNMKGHLSQVYCWGKTVSDFALISVIAYCLLGKLRYDLIYQMEQNKQIPKFS